MEYAGSEKFYMQGYTRALADVENMILKQMFSLTDQQYKGPLIELVEKVGTLIKQHKETKK